MKKIIIIIAVAFATTVSGQNLAPKDNKIHLPSVIPLKVEKVLYHHATTPHIMGDGHRAYVVQVNADDLNNFIKTNIAIDSNWTHGSMHKYKLYLSVLEWLEDWPHMKKIMQKFRKVVDLPELKKADGLYLKAEYKRDSDDFFTDATLWIIRPEKNQVIMLNGNT